MPACPRPNKLAMKIAYSILKTPKNLQQQFKGNKSEIEKRNKEWFRDSSASQ